MTCACPKTSHGHDVDLLAAVVEHAGKGIVVLGPDRDVRIWNEWMCLRAGFGLCDALGRDFFSCFPDIAEQRLGYAINDALTSGVSSLLSHRLNPYPLPLKSYPPSDEPRLPQAITVRALSVQGQTYCLIEIEDVSAAVARELKLRERAQQLLDATYLDGLTGIANRRRFDEYLPSEYRRSVRNQSPISLLLLDVDHFKHFNDLYGHQAGDECLRQVAQVIRHGVQRGGDLAARYGGEEFVVVLPETPLEAAALVAARLREAVSALNIPHADSEVAAHVTISIGVACLIPERGSQADSLVAAADFALYCAKSNGRNRVEMFVMDE